jgi:hypothetical protein
VVAIDQSIEMPHVFSLEDRRDTLYARLERGFETIAQAEAEGKDVSGWEQAWVRLLREYEAVCDQIRGRTR